MQSLRLKSLNGVADRLSHSLATGIPLWNQFGFEALNEATQWLLGLNNFAGKTSIVFSLSVGWFYTYLK
ncbi:hypothetical protein [Fictibacillus phosphorivorans]|uniref:hypothetical protein n=1 Tax=Fictibacillus phosphorivorans TaxID=1221500 RepID=UPI0011A6F5C3|nr:hypothetical protein [Fictibacillus phosphorivorans]